MQTLTLSSVETTFTYNSDGLRTNKTTGGVSHDYIWSGDTLLAEVTGDYMLRFIHDEAGKIIGFEHHLAEVDEDGETVYVLDTTYYYEKNIFGDVIAIYEEDGTKAASYAYNAYGQNHVVTSHTDAKIANLNPIRYRSYYYDSDIYLYYLQSRYYDPVTCRFVNPDAYLNANGDILGYNMFAYCGNNPVMGYDPTGYWDWEAVADIAITAGAAVLAVGCGIVVGSIVSGIQCAKLGTKVSTKADYEAARGRAAAAGLVTAGAVFGLTNNLINATYYNFFISGEGERIEGEPENGSNNDSAYTQRYVSRFERLRHTRHESGSETYDVNAWRYFSEYSVHMYGWYVTGWAHETNIPLISDFAESFRHAYVEKNAWDKRPEVDVATFLWGLTGL